MSLNAHPETVRVARRELRAVLTSWHFEGDRVDDLLVICSELLTNAIKHASEPSGDVKVRLQELAGDFRLEVTDRRPDLILPRRWAPQGENGRGLLLVRKLADDMGVATTKGRKTVWVRVLNSGQPGAVA